MIDPFIGEEIEISASSLSASDVSVLTGDFPDIFKYEADYDYAEAYDGEDFASDFLLTAKGDYGKKEIKKIVDWKGSS